MKAFLVNRVGDFGFILGIGLLLAASGSMHYQDVFAQREQLAAMTVPYTGWPLMTAACICLFIGAMGKSAQFPLHVWLPDSMEGPTPISALIHAATMVTAGIFMVTRMSPLFELSDTALSFVIVIGAITALFMGFLGIIQNDIKRVVAYSTLSQLGYMTVALGASAYNIAVFHLMTHAFFKALLFLGAGSVIIGMHHDQDMRNMGGLRKYMPITWITSLIGSLALIATPFFSGFYSKDSIIEAVAASTIAGSGFAYFAVMAGVFVTAFYSFRMYFMVFHGEEQWNHPHAVSHGHDSDAHNEEEEEGHDDHHHHGLQPGDKPHESPWVVTLPLILLAIPSVIIGYYTIEPMLFGDFFKNVIFVGENHKAMEELASEFHGGGRGFGLLLLHGQPQGAGRLLQRAQADLHAAGQQVLHGQVQRSRVRRRRARPRQRPVESGRPRHHRRPDRQWQRQAGGLVRVDRAHVPDRLHLPLRVRDDRRRAGNAAVFLPVLARLIQA
jgi:NADH-quinone oxidoreductase subunit L